MKFHKRLLVFVLALVMVPSVLASCSSRTQQEQESSLSSSSSSLPKAEPGGDTIGMLLPTDRLEAIAEAKEKNDHTRGWLVVPGTNIDDVVLFHPSDNLYYERRGFDGQYSFEGVFYADRRNVFGTAEEIGVNTCIYGHSMTDDVEDPKYDIKFGQLHNFRQEDFAREHPYIFFATEKETLAYEIFAVFVANADNPDVPYNRNDIEPTEFVKMVREEILPRSKWNYDVEIMDDDKFLVLSTCIYKLDNGKVINNYPNTFMRYAIMGRLVNSDEQYKGEALLTYNENVIIDSDGKWRN